MLGCPLFAASWLEVRLLAPWTETLTAKDLAGHSLARIARPAYLSPGRLSAAASPALQVISRCSSSHGLFPTSYTFLAYDSHSRVHATATENHSKLWTAERLLSASLLAAPVAFVVPIPGMDYLLAAAIVIHVHWGLEAIVVDYIRPSIFGPVVPKISLLLLYLLSVLSLGGLFYFNYSDVGLVGGLKMAWSRL